MVQPASRGWCEESFVYSLNARICPFISSVYVHFSSKTITYRSEERPINTGADVVSGIPAASAKPIELDLYPSRRYLSLIHAAPTGSTSLEESMSEVISEVV